jgi:hypothetical protein
VIVSFVAVSAYLRLEPLKVALLFLHIIVIFLLNDVMFTPSYFGDQWGYLNATRIIRNSFNTLSFQEISGFNMEIHDIKITGFNNELGLSGLIFALLPIPFINSFQSLCMINYIFFLLLFVFIKKKLRSDNSVDYFFLLFPSLLLYSSLALRETLILVIMFFSVYFVVIKEQKVLGLIIGFPLLILKFQNYFMILLSVMFYIILKRRNKVINIAFVLAILMGMFYPEKVPIIGPYYSKIETIRLALLAENMIKVTGKFYDWEAAKSMIEPLGSGISLVYLVAKNFLYMLFKPFPWECRNVFQIVQSVENIGIVILIIMFNSKKIMSHRVKQKILFLNLMLFVSISVYGLVVFNFGTAVRYKFPFIMIYILFYLLLLSYDKLIKNKNLYSLSLP